MYSKERRMHDETCKDVEDSIYIMTPEEEEALLLEYGVRNVITDELLPQISAPSQFQSEYGTKDVFLTAEASNAQATESRENSSSSDDDDDDDDDDDNNNNSSDNIINYNITRSKHKQRWRKIAKIRELSRHDVLTNSLQRLLIKYTLTYSYLTSETLLRATQSALHDVQKLEEREKVKNAVSLQALPNMQTKANGIHKNMEETKEILSDVIGSEVTNNNDSEMNDDIITETDQLLREADTLISSKFESTEEKLEEENSCTHVSDAKLAELTYNSLWAQEEEEEELENKEELEKVESLCNIRQRDYDNDYIDDNKQIEELIANARKHIAQLQAIRKTCRNDVTSDIKKESTTTATIIYDEAHDKSNNDNKNSTNCENNYETSVLAVNSAKNYTSEETKSKEVEELQKESENCYEEAKKESLYVTSTAESNDEEHDNISANTEVNAEEEIEDECDKNLDVMHKEWYKMYEARKNIMHSVCSAQRVRTACYVDPVHLGEGISYSSTDNTQESGTVCEQCIDSINNKEEINTQFDEIDVHAERSRHCSIMESVHHILEQRTKEEIDGVNDHTNVHRDVADILHEACNEKTAHAERDDKNSKREEPPEQRRDAEGFALLPSFVERVDELLEPTQYELAASAALSTQIITEECQNKREREREQQQEEYREQQELVEQAMKMPKENSVSNSLDKDKPARLVKHSLYEGISSNALELHTAERKNKLKSESHANKQCMFEKWRVEHELAEYHRLCKEDDTAQMRELEFAIWLAECEDKLQECEANECNSREQLSERENSMRQELYKSALMHKQLVINVMRAKQEEKLKLLISYLEHQRSSEQTHIIEQERQCWQNLQIQQQKEYNELYEAELIKRRKEEERRKQLAEEAEQMYWLPENVRSRFLSQEEELMLNWFDAHASNIQCTLDSIAEELAIHYKSPRTKIKSSAVDKSNISSSARVTFADNTPIVNEERESKECILDDKMLLGKLKEVVVQNSRLDKLSVSELTRYVYKLSFSSASINQIDYTSLQNCHARLSNIDEKISSNINCNTNKVSTSSSCNKEIAYTSFVREADLGENKLKNLQLVAFLRSFPSLEIIKLNHNDLKSLSTNLINLPDNKCNNNNNNNRSLRSVKAAYDNAISEQTCVHTLDVSHNQLTCVDEIATFLPLTLRHLYAHHNVITSIAPLVTCTHLQSLHLAHNAIQSLNGLHTLRLLREIDLSNNAKRSDDSPPTDKFSKDSEEFDLSPICNNCLLLQKLCLSHNHMNTLRLNNLEHRATSQDERHEQQQEQEQQQQHTQDKPVLESHCQQYYLHEENNVVIDVKPNVFMFMTELYVNHNKLCSLGVQVMPHMPMLCILHAEHNAITDISGLIHCPRLIHVDVSHNKLATWKDLRPIMYCQHLVEVNVLNNPCLHGTSHDKEKSLLNKQSIMEECLEVTNYISKKSGANAFASQEDVERLLLQWLPKLQKVNNAYINNHSNDESVEVHIPANKGRTSEVSDKSITSNYEHKQCDEGVTFTLDQSICEMRALLQQLGATHASRLSSVRKWETEWQEQAIKRTKVNYISPDPAYVHRLEEIASNEQLSFLQESLQYYLSRFQHEQNKAKESWRKRMELVHENARLYECEQTARATLSRWLQKYIVVWQAKRQLLQLREEKKVKEQVAKWMAALCVLQPVGRGALLRMRLRRVLSARYDTIQSNDMLMEHEIEQRNLKSSTSNDNDDDKLYVKVNEELPQLSQSISCTSDTNIVNLLRKVNVKQIPLPKLPSLQPSLLSSSSPQASTFAMFRQSESNDKKFSNIEESTVLLDSQTQSAKTKFSEENAPMPTEKSQVQVNIASEKVEAGSDESAYSAIVSAQLARKRKKINRQNEQAMKEEFIRDPLKVKKMRQTDLIK